MAAIAATVSATLTCYSTDITSTDIDSINYGKEPKMPEVPDFNNISFNGAKRAMRTGTWPVHDPVRRKLWCTFITSRYTDTNVYRDTIDSLYKSGTPITVPIPPIVDSTHQHTYYLNEDGAKTVRMICNAIHALNPDISSAPLLFPIASLLLHYMEPEHVFHCLCGMIKQRDRRYLYQTRIATACSSRLVQELPPVFPLPPSTRVPKMHKIVRKVLLLHYMEPEHVFHCLCGMIQQRDRRYLYQTRIATACSSRIVQELSRPRIPRFIRNHAENEDFDTWMWWIFSDLPFPYLVCIMDSYLLEGEKVLYRVALTILKKHSKYCSDYSGIGVSGKFDSSMPYHEQVSQFCRDMPIPIYKFMKSAFRIRRISRKRINKLLAKHEQTVEHLPMTQLPVKQNGFTGHLQEVEGSILSHSQLCTIWSWIPHRYTISTPELLYSSDTHGISIQTLFNQASTYEPTLLVIKTDKIEIFGAFCACDWKDRKIYSYFGTGESFLFALVPECVKYPWVGHEGTAVPKSSEMYMSGGNTHLIVGGGASGSTAIHLDSLLEHCSSRRCDTFANPPLCEVNEIHEFSPIVVQVFGFTESEN